LQLTNPLRYQLMLLVMCVDIRFSTFVFLCTSEYLVASGIGSGALND
jgi:hypothetical protein